MAIAKLTRTARIAWLCFFLSGLGFAAVFLNLEVFRDRTGSIATFDQAGKIDTTNAFFQQLGTNGRTCATCHQADEAFGLSARHAHKLFVRTGGQDPLFAPVDGANCPNLAQDDASAHSLLLKNGLIRVGITLPAQTEFSIVSVYDPYGCGITTDPETGRPLVSVYRRPLPSTNLRFLSTVMFDGRETIAPLNNEKTFASNLVQDLKHQATDAVLIHSQATQPPTDDQVSQIVNFELGLFTAQLTDDRAGPLYANHGQGGPVHLAFQAYYPGINDSLGMDPRGLQFDPHVFRVYTGWLAGSSAIQSGDDGKERARQDIAAGEELFNTAALKITGVRGLNDNPSLGYPKVINGTCTTCHDTPEVGNHSFPLPLDIATSRIAAHESDENIAAALHELSQPDVPIFLISNCPDPQNPGHLLEFYTSDAGKGLITGKCSDVNRIKGPVLRGLAARAPYFHNGAAADLKELVNFYNVRFQMKLSEEQKQQLVAFLNSL